MKKYVPIACERYDELELYAMRRKTLMVKYKEKNGGKPLLIVDRIRTLKTVESIEYMVLSSGLELRLDRVISVDGKKISGLGDCGQ